MDPVQYTGPENWIIHDPSRWHPPPPTTRIVATDGLLMTAVTGKENADGYR